MFLLVLVRCHTAQALVFLLVSVCCDTAQALVFLLVSVCCDTAQALVFLLVSVCCDIAQAKAGRPSVILILYIVLKSVQSVLVIFTTGPVEREEERENLLKLAHSKTFQV